MYQLEFTPEALEDLKWFRKFDQEEFADGIEDQLSYEPTTKTRNRKELRPNDVAAWELRLGKFRVFYNVEQETLTVSIEAIGFKIANVLFIRGEERML